MLVRSRTLAQRAQADLHRRVAQAQAALDAVLVRRRGTVCRHDLSSAQQAVEHFLTGFGVAEVVQGELDEQVTRTQVRAYRERAAQMHEQREVTLTTQR